MPRMFDKGAALDPWMFDGKVWQRIMRSIYIMPNGCWYWKKHKDKNGYGQISVYIDGKQWSSMGVYRVVFAIYNGSLLAGNVVHHLCNFPPCCNPDHLEQMSCYKNCAEAGRNTQKKLRKKKDAKYERLPF